MKKNYLAWGLMLVASLTLTNCAKEQVVNEPVTQKGVPFELTVGVDTKTTTTDASTINWADADSLNVFHAVAGSDTYGSNDKFTFDSGTKFTGVLKDGALTADAYDWYVLYPYNSVIVEPNNTSKGYLTVGSSYNGSQTQKGNGNKAHLAGSNIPLYGKAASVAKDAKPTITLKQAVSVVKVHVTNKNAKPLTVTNVSFVAPEYVVGTYYIDITGENPVFTASQNSTKTFTYASETANLTVTNGDAINQNAEADFFIAIKPFTAAAGKTLKVSVNGYEKSLDLEAAATFAPGKIKTINFSYDKVEAAPISTEDGPVTVGFETAEGFSATTSYNNAEVKFQGAEGHRWGIVSGSTSTTGAIKGSQSMLLRDYTANGFQPYVYTEYRLSSVKEVQFQAKRTSSSQPYQLKLSYSTDLGDTWTDAETYDLSTSAETYKHVFGSIVSSAMFKFTIVFPGTRENKKDVIIDDVIFSKTEIVPAPVITVTSANPMPVANTASSQEITYTIDNPTEAVLSADTEATWITGISTSTAGKVTFNVAAQEAAAAARSADITLKYTGAEDVVVRVNQAAGASSGPSYTWNLEQNDLGEDRAPEASVTKGVLSTTSAGITWNVDYSWPEGAQMRLLWDSNNNRGVQIGTGSAAEKCNSVSLTTTGFTAAITKIVVGANTASSGNASLSVSVNGTPFTSGEQTSVTLNTTTTPTTYEFTGNATGTVVISITNSANKAIYLKSIKINTD